MKKGILVLFVLILVGCAFFTGRLTNSSENDKTNNYSDAIMNKSELVGVWEAYNGYGILEEIIVFNEYGEIFDMTVFFDEFGRMIVDYYNQFSYVDLGNNLVKVTRAEGTKEIEYSINNEDLILGGMEFSRKNTTSDNSETIVGTWHFYNNMRMPFDLVNLSLDMQEISFYDDNSYSLIQNGGFVQNGDYRIIHEGNSIELSRKGTEDIYSTVLIGHGLMLLSCTGNATGIGNTNAGYYCLLEKT